MLINSVSQCLSSLFLNELTDEASTIDRLRKTVPVVDCSLTEKLLSESETASGDIQSQAVSSGIVMSRCQSEELLVIDVFLACQDLEHLMDNPTRASRWPHCSSPLLYGPQPPLILIP